MPSFLIEFDQNGVSQRRTFDSNAVSFGREQGVDFVVNNPTVSRQHAMIMFDPRSGYILRVLSRGGMTAVNGVPVSGDIGLQDGAMVQLGQFNFIFRANTPQAQPASPFGSAGFGQPMHSAGFQSPAPMPSQPPMQGGFGQQPAPGGFASSPQPQPQSAFGAAAAPQPQAAQKAPLAGNTVWDEIAASAEAQEDNGPRELTDFQRMQQAESRAKEKEGPNVLLIGIAVIAVLTVGAFVFLSMGSNTAVEETSQAFEDQPEFQVNIACVGQDDCVDQARQSYKVGLQLLEKRDANVAHLFEGYKKLYESKAFLEKGKSPAPEDMNLLEPKMKEARGELDALFRNYRVVYFKSKQRKMHKDMADALGAIKTYFPDKTSREFKFALESEIEMKSQGIYPTRVE